MLCFSIAFAKPGDDNKSAPASDKEATPKERPYYAGMTKEMLYKIYPVSSQENYFKKGDEEWIVFDDVVTTSNLKDVIAFYLKDGKVLGWDKRRLPKSPQERSDVITERHKHGVGVVNTGSVSDDSDYKRQTRRRRIDSRRW